MGGVHRVTEALGAGVHFWRVRARYGGELGPPSAAWEFVVQGTASSMVSWYGFVDVDRDGVAEAVLRGGSERPLWVTAAGMDPREACARVREMHGAHRIPTLLKRVDALCRGR